MSIDISNEPDAGLDDDVTLVDGSAEAAEAEARAAKTNAALLSKVEKILEKDSPGSASGKPTKQSGGDEKHAADGERDEKPEDLSQALKDRASEAGIPGDLALRLHQSGLLEESLAMFDRQTIERAAKGPKQEPTEPPKRKEGEPEARGRSGEDDGAPPPLSAEDFDEPLVKRDAFFQKQIADLKAQVAELSQLRDGAARERKDRAREWFAGKVAGLKNAKLFGTGSEAADSAEQKNQRTLWNGYVGMCLARGVDPLACDDLAFERAFPAMFREEVFKAGQRETLQRLRDAEGRFITPSQSSAGGPPLKRQPTKEEQEAALLKKVTGIMSRKGA